MSDTTYVDFVAPAVNAEWLNEVNDHVWHNTPVTGSTVHSATVISVSPTGNLSSSTVQDALVELQSDVDTRATSSDLSDHINNLTSAHNSSAISFIPSGSNAVSTNVQGKLREWVSYGDYTTSADTVAAATGTVFVNTTSAIAPISSATKNILWEYRQGGDSDNVLKSDGTRGGLFADYDCKASKVLVAQITEDQSAISGGGFRDLLFCNTVDTDTTNYTAIGQKVTYGIRSFVQGSNNGTSYQSQYKDLVGGYFSASGNVQWAARGVSAITADAYQFGIGIASNEFSAINPSAANGGISQSQSMAAIQAIVRSQYASEDASHISRGVYVENNGNRITSGIELISNTTGGWGSQFKFGLNMSAATVSQSAIYMPFSASGNVGTTIEYDSGDSTLFDRSSNRFIWSIAGTTPFAVTPNGISIGSATTTGTRLFIEPSTTALSSLRIYQGVAPTSPQDGDLWYDGTNLKFRVGGTTKTFTLV